MDPLSRQLADVHRRCPQAQFELAPDGQRLLVVPGVSVGPAWNRPEATLLVVVPSGYPHVNMDCFYTDAVLCLASGADPANSSLQSVFGSQLRWFSWHMSAWDPTTVTLDRYLRFCEVRLREGR